MGPGRKPLAQVITGSNSTGPTELQITETALHCC